MTKVRFFNPGLAYRNHKEEIDRAIQDTLDRGDLILRGDLEEFEAKLAKYVGTAHAVGVGSGTDALYLCLLAHGIGPDDTVLCPSYTFRATPDVALRVGAKVRLYDLGERPSLDGVTVFMPAHIAGHVEDWIPGAIREAHTKEILVIEDAAQAIGAAPVRGKAACYSFYPAKILGAPGDAGAIATDDPALADWLRRARNHFKGETGDVGLNSRLDNVWAAVLNIRIDQLPQNIEARKSVARRYDTAFADLCEIPAKREVYQDYIIGCKDAQECDALYGFLAEKGVETMRNGYPFAKVLTKGPKTVEFEARSLRLPCNENITNEEVQYVIYNIKEYYVSN